MILPVYIQKDTIQEVTFCIEDEFLWDSRSGAEAAPRQHAR